MTVYCTTPATLRLENLNAAGTVVNSLDLMDQANGYRVASLDIGFPTVRAVVAALPTRDGDADYTALYGPRTVTVTGSFVPSAAGSRQKALQALAWWCQPRLRPRLVYALDADSPPLWVGLRGSALTAVASNPFVSAFSVSWVAPDPVSRVLTATTVTANPPATFNVTNGGTYRAWPVVDFYGPATQPALGWVTPAAGGIYFVAGFTVAAGHFVRVDTYAQTVLLDGGATSQYSSLDFAVTRWPGLEPGVTTLAHSATTSSAPAHVVVTWADSTI